MYLADTNNRLLLARVQRPSTTDSLSVPCLAIRGYGTAGPDDLHLRTVRWMYHRIRNNLRKHL
jgi:hypothetical protein